MEKIPTEFKGRAEVSGTMFTQLKREGDICLYKRVDPDGFTAYEVVKVIPTKAMTAVFKGVSVNYEAKERYPQSGQWGATERTTRTLEKAEEYFEQFCRNEKNKPANNAEANTTI